MEIEITRDEFEESIQTYLEKTKMLIEEVMEASGMNPKKNKSGVISRRKHKNSCCSEKFN